jgi:50S ribosomal subunit-associated GTPase HflX
MDTSLIDHSRTEGQILEPFIRKIYTIFTETCVFYVGFIHHLPHFLFRKVLEGLLRISDPTQLIAVVKNSNEINKFDESLVSHYANSSI